MTELNATAIVEVLTRHGVDFVVIGAFAAITQQAPIPATRDIDFTPERGAANLGRLSAALRELGARIRVDGIEEGFPFNHDAESLGAVRVWNLVCDQGEFDLSFAPSGFDGGYADLVGNAHRMLVGDVVVLIADLADVIRSKEAAGRPKDLRVLPTLYAHLAQRER